MPTTLDITAVVPLIVIISLIISGVVSWIVKAYYSRQYAMLATTLHREYAWTHSASYNELQTKIRQWHRENHPKDDESISLIAIGEELGEVMRAHVKQAGGIRGTWEYWQAEKEKEAGDVMIGLFNYLAQCNIDADAAFRSRWMTISQRDYKNNPFDGGRKHEL